MILREQDIRWFEIAMQNVSFVRMLHGSGCIGDNAGRFTRRQWALGQTL